MFCFPTFARDHGEQFSTKVKMKYISGRKEFPFVELERRLKWFVDIKCGVPFPFWWVNRAATLSPSREDLTFLVPRNGLFERGLQA